MISILIAEDDQFLSKMYRMNVESPGWDVRFVEDGQAAIDALDESLPDLLLLDIMMPHVDGVGVLKHIQEKEYDLPVIVLTNLSQESDRARCLELGAKDFFVKSDMDLDELNSLIRKYV